MHQINLLSRVFFGSYSRGFILVLVLLFIRKAKKINPQQAIVECGSRIRNLSLIVIVCEMETAYTLKKGAVIMGQE